MHSNFGLSRDEGFGEKMRENKIARKCTKILVSCICHHTINSLPKTFCTKILNPPHITYMNISQSNISYRSGFNEFRFRNLYLKIWPVTQAFRLKCVFSAKSFKIKQNYTFQVLKFSFCKPKSSPLWSSYSSKLLDYFV